MQQQCTYICHLTIHTVVLEVKQTIVIEFMRNCFLVGAVF